MPPSIAAFSRPAPERTFERVTFWSMPLMARAWLRWMRPSALKAALDKEDHIALYVNFDFNKAILKPDAALVIAQVAKLMTDNPGLKLEIN